MSRVRVLSVSHVRTAHRTSTDPPRAAAVDDDYKLSFLDAVHVPKVPIQRLFFFDGPNPPPFASVVGALRSSLAATLAVFFPLAGQLAFRASTGDVVIDCSPAAVSSGVKFVEAELCSGGADDMRRMAGYDRHDTEAFLQLVPEMDVGQLPAPILAVQVTRPAPVAGKGSGVGVGAVAVGVSILHAVADGQAMWQFMRAWSTASREGPLAEAGLSPPTFDRAAIRHPNADELCRMCLRMFAPALPLLRPPSSSSSTTPGVSQQSRRTFVLSADRIQSLKQHISRAAGGGQLPSKPPSTYVAISSLVWASMVRAKSMDPADDVHFSVAADCRRRLRPPASEGYFGNCVRACFARLNAGDLRGGGGVARAAAAIQACIHEQLEEAAEDDLLSMPTFLSILEVLRGIPMDRLTSVGSSHRFTAYETDFGWGTPRRVELVSMFRRELVTLLAAREGGGAVQVSVSLDDGALMDAFAANFLAGGGQGGAEAEW